MRKILFLLVIFGFLGCSKENIREPRSFSIEASMADQGDVYPINQEFTVYYFEGIDVTNGYSPQPDGILIEDETGNSISYTEKFIVENEKGIVILKDLPRDMHSFIIDVSNTFRQDIEIDTIIAQAFNMDLENDAGYGIEITFNISPYTPTTVYQ